MQLTVVCECAARQGTSYQFRHLANQYEWMSVNHFLYLPIVKNPENNPYNQTVIRISPPKFNHLFIGPLRPSLNISYKSVRKPLRKVANRETNRQRRLHRPILLGGGNNYIGQNRICYICKHRTKELERAIIIGKLVASCVVSGITSVFGRRAFAVLLLTCSWWVTTYVGKPSAIGQTTRPTQPFIISGSINE